MGQKQCTERKNIFRATAFFMTECGEYDLRISYVAPQADAQLRILQIAIELSFRLLAFCSVVFGDHHRKHTKTIFKIASLDNVQAIADALCPVGCEQFNEEVCAGELIDFRLE